MLICCFHLSAHTLAQTITLKGRNLTLHEVFAAIRQQTNYEVAANREWIAQGSRVSISVKEMQLAPFLAMVLKDQPLDFKINDKMIILYRKKGDGAVAHAEYARQTQATDITGTVRDQTGKALPGVSVRVLNTNAGAQTDGNGHFQLKQVATGARLEFTSLGYSSMHVAIRSVDNQLDAQVEEDALAENLYTTRSAAGLSLSVVMEERFSDLDEVVVVGYGTMRRSDMTGAISSIKGETLVQAPPNSIQSALSGRIPGVTISPSDNAPGAGLNVLIRGGNTLTGGNQPLYVIDGFPLLPDQVSSAAEIPANPLSDISPEHIASIEVLKDASATAIYGAAGSNGVILITTKSGSAKAQIDVSANNSLSRLSNVPHVLTPEEFVNYKVDMGLAELYYPSNTMETNTANLRNWKQRRYEFYNNPNAYKGSQWLDEISRTANTANVDIGFSNTSRDKTFNYRVGVGLFDQEGVIINTRFQRQNLNVNLNQKVGKRIDIGGNLIMSKAVRKGIVDPWSSSATVKRSLMANPFQPREWSRVRDGEIDDPMLYEWTADNILHTVNLLDNDNQESRLLANLNLTYRITPDLLFNTSYGTNRRLEDKSTFKSPELHVYAGQGGIAEFVNRRYDNWVYQGRLSYDKQLGKHSLNGTAVFEAKRNTSKYFAAAVQKFQESERGIWDLSTATEAVLPLANLLEEDAMLSYLGRLFYGYDGKYLLTASLRADGTSKFGDNNKWGTFPSVALAWVASNEPFLQDVDFLSHLKLRLSYGVTGNNQIGNYRSLSQLGSVKYPFGSDLSVGFVHGSIANKDLKWEKTAQYNIGLDANFFSNRLQLTAEAYEKQTTDLLLEVQIPMTSGYSTAVQNVGSMRTRGYEIGLSSVNIDRAFRWSTSFTFSAYRTNIVSLGDKQEMGFLNNIYWGMSNNILLRVGEPVGLFYGYIEDGVMNSGTEIANSPDQSGVLGNDLGQSKYVDVNQDGRITEADKVPIARTVPDFTGGMGNEFAYKNFDLVVFARWSVGNDVINGNTSHMTENYKNWNTIPAIAHNVWSPLNPHNNSVGMNNNFWLTDMRSSLVEDGSFLKIDYITLGYTLPQKLTDRLRVSRFRVFARANNPFIFTRYTWFDPEVSTGWGTVAQVGPGVDLSSYPRTSGMDFGLNVTF